MALPSHCRALLPLCRREFATAEQIIYAAAYSAFEARRFVISLSHFRIKMGC